MNPISTSEQSGAINIFAWLSCLGFAASIVVLISLELNRLPWHIQWHTAGNISDEVWRAIESVRYRGAFALLVALNFNLYMLRRRQRRLALNSDPLADLPEVAEPAGVGAAEDDAARRSPVVPPVPLSTPIAPPSDEHGCSSNNATTDSRVAEAERETALLRQQLEDCEQRLEVANRARVQFLSNMSHEMRTPMNAIVGMSDLLLGGSLDAREERFVRSIAESANTLLGIINDLLDFSKIESGSLRLEHASFSVRECVEDVCISLARQAHLKNIELICYVDENVPDLMEGDPSRVRQILNNLISNAIAFTVEGEVVVRLHRQQSDKGTSVYQCDVQDTGAGISPERQYQLFEAFHQADQSTTRTHGGLGMGLTIARQLVTMMHGEISFRSRLGEGSRFSFTMQLDDLPETENTTIKRRALLGARVLVVDDNETNRTILYHQLSNWGLIVETASSGALALQALRAAHERAEGFDVLILDLHMPEMDGIALAKAIQAEADFRHIRSIMLTSALLELDGRELRRLGIHKHVSKPARQSVLHDSLVSLMPYMGAVPAAVASSQPEPEADLPQFNAKVLLTPPFDASAHSRTPALSTAAEQLGDVMAAEELIDAKAIDAIRTLQRPGKPDLLQQVISLYFDKAPALIGDMHAGLAEQDFARISASAHSLKSSSAYLGVSALAARCRALESAVTGQDAELLHTLLADIDDQYERARNALMRLCDTSVKAA